MSEISDKFLVDEIKDLREKESLLKRQIDELHRKMSLINLRFISTYDKNTKVLDVEIRSKENSMNLKYDVDTSGSKLRCSARYLYSYSLDFETLINLGNLFCPDDVTDLFDCIWREGIE